MGIGDHTGRMETGQQLDLPRPDGTSDSGPKRQQGSSFASVTQTPRRNYGHQLIRFTSVDFDDDVKSAVVSCVIRGQLFRVCRQCVNDARTSAVCARALCNLQSVRGRSSAGLQKQSDFLSFHPPRSPRGPVSPGALCYLNQSTMALMTITVVLVWSSTSCKYGSCRFFRSSVFVRLHLLMDSQLRFCQ